MILKIQKQSTLIVPDKTRLITNGEWITLARKSECGVYLLFTCRTEDIDSLDLLSDSLWHQYTKDELKRIINQ